MCGGRPLFGCQSRGKGERRKSPGAPRGRARAPTPARACRWIWLLGAGRVREVAVAVAAGHMRRPASRPGCIDGLAVLAGCWVGEGAEVMRRQFAQGLGWDGWPVGVEMDGPDGSRTGAPGWWMAQLAP